MALIFLRGRRLTRPALDSVKQSTKSLTISRLPIPSMFARTIYTTKSSGGAVESRGLQRRRYSSLTQKLGAACLENQCTGQEEPCHSVCTGISSQRTRSPCEVALTLHQQKPKSH